MQIQGDFVTNSSSTGYIIFVPNSYYVDKGNLRLAMQMAEEIHNISKLTDEQIIVEIPAVIELMKSGEAYYYDDYDLDYERHIWLICLQLFTLEDFVVGGFEIGSDGNTCMTGIAQKNITDVLINNVDLDDMVKTLIKGANDEKQNTE